MNTKAGRHDVTIAVGKYHEVYIAVGNYREATIAAGINIVSPPKML